MKSKTSFATLLTLAFFTAGYAQTLDKAKLDQFFDRLAEKNKAMGSLTIVKDGNVLYTRAIGYSQINPKKPLTAANRFRIGSITKMFTAAMILQLVEEGVCLPQACARAAAWLSLCPERRLVGCHGAAPCSAV